MAKILDSRMTVSNVSDSGHWDIYILPNITVPSYVYIKKEMIKNNRLLSYKYIILRDIR